ncbi:MAG: hypothetical protein KDE22_06805 [Rhodobacterales bacterium]|nr:hypothetical protein [Rhodobacterales bacterium]
MAMTDLPPQARLKSDLMFNGLRYTPSLGAAAEHAFPNWSPYRFQPGEANPTGRPTAPLPYLLRLADGTTLRVRGSGKSAWSVDGDKDGGYHLRHDDGRALPVSFVPLPGWMRGATADGTPMAQCGVSMLGSMAVVNVAPGCQYFQADGPNGESRRCLFCTYGAPDMRSKTLGQDMDAVLLPAGTYAHMAETLDTALNEGGIRTVYLVGGSMTDWSREADRFIDLADKVRAVVGDRATISCGSGALPDDKLKDLHARGTVDNVCFNLEVWSEPLFAKVCPGKQAFVGHDRWIASLETAVGLWGRGRVYSAMVAGVELEPEVGLTWEQAAETALKGAEDLCSRGIIPVYSLYWPLGGKDHPDYLSNLMNLFETLNAGYAAIRRRHGLHIWDGFLTHQAAYMQLECDIDREVA